LIKTIEEGTEEGWDNYIKGAGFDGIFISRVKGQKNYMGRSIGDIAKSENRNPYDVIFDLLMKEQYNVIALYAVMGEDDMVEIMKAPHTMIGSDGFPGFGDEKIHPRQLGTFPRVLGRYVRENQVMTLEEAVRRMTSLPARTFGLRRKGVLKKGFDADLVVFDPETIIDGATYKDPYQAPQGISHVMVNGQVVVENGRICGVAAGKVLRHGQNV
jgi:N-acyl-D-amino-acid deacylase